MQTYHSQTEALTDLAIRTLEWKRGELQQAVSRCLPLLHRRAYRYLGNSHDAEDAVQDALLSAYKHLDQFHGDAQMTTWLTSIVTNSALTQIRRKSGRHHSSLDEPLAHGHDQRVSDTLVDVRPSPEDECSVSELHGRLIQFVGRLSPILREVIQLRDFDGLTTREAAHILGVPEGTIKARVWRARSELKRRADRGVKPATLIHDAKIRHFPGRHKLSV